uniref:Lymphocyte cytosolic protein 2 n=1 Tax=Malurus cyaneus samueli TaxID=2593467 RepID=A0A8C5X8I4_9PASS
MNPQKSCYTDQTQKCLLFVIFHFFTFQDGTFLVRDSSRKTVTHPYVLMVLYRDKVYNIQIRYQEQDHLYLLGTGLKGKEDFSSVADIIDHFQRTPLLLIDGKDRGSRNQCMLKYHILSAMPLTIPCLSPQLEFCIS